MPLPPPLRVAHRGMPLVATENTLRSFELALEYGAQGIELDVHLSGDGVVVVHHDATLASGTQINGATLAELVAEAPTLATLGAVCDLIGGRAELFVEIKGLGIEEEVEASLEGYVGRAAIHSFDHDLIHRLALGGTRRRLGILVDEDARDALHAMSATGAMDLWPHHSLVTAGMVSGVHAFGGRVIPWTVNARRDVDRLKILGVDGICTDDVRSLA